MRISFVHDWEPNHSQEMTWEDGLAGALLELQNRGHEVQVLTVGDENTIIRHPYFDIGVVNDVKAAIKKHEPDVILMWGDCTRPNAKPVKTLGIPMALCFAGGDVKGETGPLFDHIFVESEVYKEQFEHNGHQVSIAFGTNTDRFQPIEQPKMFDTIFPATFAAWKRHGLYADATQGLRSLAVGYMYYDHETDCWQDCIKKGITVLPHASAQMMQYLYAASKLCIITSDSTGGSQRTVLEAMAMNVPLIVTDSDKYDWAGERIYHCSPDAQEIRAFAQVLLDGDGDVNTRDYVLQHWSHIQYADALEEGLKAII